MKGKEQSKIKEDIVKDLEKIIEAIEKATRIVFPVPIKINERRKFIELFPCKGRYKGRFERTFKM